MNDYERDYLRGRKPTLGEGVMYLIAALFLAFLMWQLFIRPASAGTGDLPQKITTTAPVRYVSCGGGVCCGEVTVKYQRPLLRRPVVLQVVAAGARVADAARGPERDRNAATVEVEA